MALRNGEGVLLAGLACLWVVAAGCDEESEAPATGATTGTAPTGTTTGTTATGTGQGGAAQGGNGQGGVAQGGAAQGGSSFVFQCGSGQGGAAQGGSGGQGGVAQAGAAPGGSGQGGGGCVKCAQWTSGADPSTICDASCVFAEPLATCACVTECAGPCGGNFCVGNAPSGGCTNCRANNCTDELSACEGDT